MSKEKHQSLTPATQWLKEHKIPFEERSYEYEEHGGTALAAAALTTITSSRRSSWKTKTPSRLSS